MTELRTIRGRYGSGAGETDDVRIDAASGELTSIDHGHSKVHKGEHYFVVGYQDLAANEVLDFTWQMPANTKWIHWTWRIITESETLWQVYEGATATNPLANAVTPLNNNRNSGNASGTTMKFELQTNLAAANADTSIGAAALIESGISGDGKESGNGFRGHELILDQGVLYCLRATASVAGYINFDMQWYEMTSRH